MKRVRMSLKHNKTWNCPTYIKRLQIDKLEVMSMKCRFIGYPKEIMGCYLSQPSNRKMFMARRAIFFFSKGNFLQEEVMVKKLNLIKLN